MFATACAVGVACGAVNAVLIHGLRIKSIIVTIATLNVFYGILIFITKGNYIYSLPDWFSAGITWFEFEQDQIPYYLNFQMVTPGRRLRDDLVPAQPHQHRPADLRHGRQSGCLRAGSASTSSACT